MEARSSTPYVIVRCVGPRHEGGETSIQVVDGKTARVIQGSKTVHGNLAANNFTFNDVWQSPASDPSDDEQIMIYQRVGVPAVRTCINGKSSLVLGYGTGQEGLLFGTGSLGLVPRVASAILAGAASDCSVVVSACQL